MFVSSVVRWKAPRRPRRPVTLLIAASTISVAVFGSVARSAVVARAELIQPAVDAAQLARVDAADADAGLLIADHLRAELEHRPAAVDGEADRRAAAVGDGQRQVERRGVDAERVAVAVGRDAVDGGDDVGAFVAGGAQAGFEAAASAFFEHFDIDEGVAAVSRSIAARAMPPLSAASTPVASLTRLTASTTWVSVAPARR